MSKGKGEGAWRIHVDGERSDILEDIRRTRRCGLVVAWVPLSACWRSGRSGDHVSDYHPTASPSTSVYTPPHCPCDDMAFRGSLVRLRKRMKEGLLRPGDKQERGEGANAGGETSVRLSSQSDPGVVVEGWVRGEESRTGGEDNLPPQSVVGRGETSQADPHPHAEVESGPGREGRSRADTPRSDIGNRTPTPSIPQGGESEGT